jgi:hypothetical protein
MGHQALNGVVVVGNIKILKTMNEIAAEKQVHVIFPLQKDEDGYPDFATERMWAVKLPDNEFRIMNSPFYAYGISWGDIVEAKEVSEDVYEFIKVKKRGGWSTFRFVAEKDVSNGYLDNVIAALNSLGCGTETSGTAQNFVTISAPPDTDPGKVGDLLAEEMRKGLIDFEEASIPNNYVSRKK